VPSVLCGMTGRDVVSALCWPGRSGEGISLQLELTSLSSGNGITVVMCVVVGVIVDGLVGAAVSAPTFLFLVICSFMHMG
jgi:hypothetical protein